MVNPREAKTFLLVCLLTISLLPAQVVLADGAEPIYDMTTDLVARRTTTPPLIDGVAESAWDGALALEIFATGDSENFYVDLRAMFDDDYIYILASWNEFAPGAINKDRDAWELTSNVTPGTWDHKDWGTDRLSFFFQDPDDPVENFTTQGCDAICHDLVEMYTKNPGEKLDAWVWSAATTNAQGYADDGVLLNNNSVTFDNKTMHVTISDMAWDSGGDGWIVNNDTTVNGTRPTHVWDPTATPTDPSYMFESDAISVDWSSFDITTVPAGSMVPGHVLKTPTGDRADIQAKGVHNGTGWNVEFKRLRNTSSVDDVIFDDVNTAYYFSPSLTNNQTGEKHGKGITAYKLWLAEPEEPDLAIQRITPVGTKFTVNTTVQAGVFVENIGWADAGASTLSFGWKGTSTTWTASVPAIGWGKTHYVAVTADTAGLTPGNNTLEVTLDSLDDIAEINETNNMGEIIFNLTDESLPNLWIESISLTPDTPTENGYTQVLVIVKNLGTETVASADIMVHLNDPLDALDTGTVGPLTPDGMASFSTIWGPIPLSAGSYIMNASVDGDDKIKELDETDNEASVPFDIAGPTLPDLLIEELIPLSTSVTQGTETATQVVIANAGGATATTDFEVALFIDQAFTVGTAGLLTTLQVTEDVPVGSNTTITMLWTISDDITVGPHFLRAEVDWMGAVDELEEGNNNGTFDDLIVLRRDLPDLIVESVSPPAPTAKLETLLTMFVVVRNVGNLSSSATTLTVVDVDHNDTLAAIPVPALNITNSSLLEFQWLVTSVPEGDLLLQFQVDAADFIREESEFNNALSVTLVVGPADLAELRVAEDGITFTPAEPRIGDAVTISIEVVNSGTSASENTTLEVWQGNNRIANQDLLVLGVGESRTLDVVWAANNILSPMTYPILVKVDPGNEVKELDESNNEHEAFVTFVQPPEAVLENLVVTASKAKVTDGAEVTVTVSVDNTGAAPDLVTLVVKDGETEIASEQITVAAGGNKTETFTIKLKGTGDHSITVTVFRGGDVVLDPSGEDLVDGLTVKVKKKPDDPGFGAALMVMALLGAVLVAASRRRSK